MDVNELSSLLACPSTILAYRGAAAELSSDAVAPLTKAHGLNGWGVLEAILWNLILRRFFWLYVVRSSMPTCLGLFVFFTPSGRIPQTFPLHLMFVLTFSGLQRTPLEASLPVS